MPHHALEVVLTRPLSSAELREACEWAVGWRRVGVSGIAVWMSW